VTVFPPATGVNAAPATVGPITIPGSQGVSGVNVVLAPPQGITPGVTVVSPDFGTETSASGAPAEFWRSPFEMQISPSDFPSNTNQTVIATQLVIQGTDSTTGLIATKVVPIGGSVGGIATGAVVGSQPITVNVPALYPLHGPITTSVRYSVAAGPFPGVSPQPFGLNNTQILDFTYPPPAPPAVPSDPLPAYFLNVGDINGANVGGGSITGTDAAAFSIVPLSSFGVPPGSQDCGSAATALQQFNGVGSNPPSSTECGIAVQFTPTGHTQLYYRATLNVPVQSGANHGTATVSLLGCDARVAAQAGYEACGQGVGGEVAMTTVVNNPDGTTTVTVTITNPDDSQTVITTNYDGNGDVTNQTVTIVPGGDGNGTTFIGGMYIDPSGTVDVSAPGGAEPFAGATVTLEQAGSAAGPFSAVPNGSSVMSPSNRVNPATSDAQGSFGWDVLSGYYEITATASGCSTASSPVLTIPPPVTGLVLTLTCSSPPTRATTTTALTASSNPITFGAPLAFSAQVAGAAPTGTVNFSDGSTLLGSAPVAGNGAATLTGSNLTPGSHSITATYTGDGANQPSTSSPISETVTAPSTSATPTIVTTSLPNAKVGQAYAATLVATGGTTPYQWTASGHFPAGLSLDGSTGAITGTPTAPGQSRFTVHLTDSAPRHHKATAKLVLQIIPSAISISPATLPSGTHGAKYHVKLAASGGNKPYAFGVTSGTLPPGLSLDSKGNLTGTPTQAGGNSFSVTATDKNSNTGTVNYTLTIN